MQKWIKAARPLSFSRSMFFISRQEFSNVWNCRRFLIEDITGFHQINVSPRSFMSPWFSWLCSGLLGTHQTILSRKARSTKESQITMHPSSGSMRIFALVCLINADKRPLSWIRTWLALQPPDHSHVEMDSTPQPYCAKHTKAKPTLLIYQSYPEACTSTTHVLNVSKVPCEGLIMQDPHKGHIPVYAPQIYL